jgi:PAS domain S-box-containing protein
MGPQSEVLPLDAVLITHALKDRPGKAPDARKENVVLHKLIAGFGQPSRTALQVLVDAAIELSGMQGRGTAGVSLLEPDGQGGLQFRWTALSGVLAPAVGGTTPRDFSPCGVCMDAGEPVLFSYPERRFTYFQQAGQPLVEGLVVPFALGTPWQGTIWLITHVDHHFDQGTVQMLTMLAEATGTVYALQRTREDLAAQTLVNVQQGADFDRQRRPYDALLSNTPDFAYVWSTDHKFLYANKALLALYGLPKEEVIGRGFEEVGYPAWHARMHEREIDEVVRTKQPVRGKIPFYAKGGGGIYDYIFIPVFDAHGEVEAVAGTTRDVTELERISDALKESDRRKDEFLATLAHELRNPLAPLRLGTELLNTDDAATREATVVMLKRQVEQMVHLVDDLMDLSRISRGAIELRTGTHRLRTILEAALETARPLCEQRGHAVELHWPSEGPTVNGDATRLTQIFANLLNNAAKYTPEGGRIAVHVEPRDGHVEVRISDNGIGISPEDQRRVFEMFTQVDRRNDRSLGGLGIGLHIVQQLVQMHHGHVTATSEGTGKGSCFTVSLPLATAAQSTPLPPAAAAHPATLRILVVDDNVDAAFMLSMILKRQGHEVHAIHGGEEALAIMPEFKPDLVLMDIGMPNMDGYEACRRMRSMDALKHTHIIALTGWSSETDKQRVRNAGFDQHLVKPLSGEELAAVMQELAERKYGPAKPVMSVPGEQAGAMR